MILIDDRIGSIELARVIPIKVGKLTRLNCGDVSFMGRGKEGPVPIGVERKAILDLVNSMTSGRLVSQQMLAMKNTYAHNYLIVEGLWKGEANSGVLVRWKGKGWAPVELGTRRFMARDVNLFLNTISVMFEVKIWKTDSLRHTGDLIQDLYRWWSKEWEKHKGHKQFHTPLRRGAIPLKKPPLTHRIAKELTGVGWEKGEGLAKRFGTPLELVMASEKELEEVEGIGGKLAKRIVGELRGG